MDRTKIDETDADDEQLRQWQDTLSGEIIQELALVIFRRALQRAEAELDNLKERTTERMTETARGPKDRTEAVLADQYLSRAEEEGRDGEE
jgi:molecular chaperone GrpE (heat shock protein)